MVLPEVTTLAEARVAIRDLAEEVEKLSNELAWFKRQMFGSKTGRGNAPPEKVSGEVRQKRRRSIRSSFGEQNSGWGCFCVF